MMERKVCLIMVLTVARVIVTNGIEAYMLLDQSTTQIHNIPQYSISLLVRDTMVTYSSTLKKLITPPYCPPRSILRATLFSSSPN